VPDTKTAQIGLSDAGVLIVRIKEGALLSLADASENLTVAIAVSGGQRRPLLVDIRGAQPLDADVLHLYSGHVLVERFLALAVLVEASPLGRMIGNLYIRFARPGIPTQLFLDEEVALEWLIGVNSPASVRFESDRVASLLDVLTLMAAGDTKQRLQLSVKRDELDAIAHGINMLVGELQWTSARVPEEHQARVSELQEAVARAERANAAKSTFLRNVSHELRTPLAAVLQVASLLESAGLSQPDQADLVRRLQANCQAVLSLLGDLLDLARLDVDKMSVATEPVSMHELLREVLASLEFEYRKKGLTVQIDAAPNALGALHTDRNRLRQVLVNLMANAIKFTETGGVVVSLRVTPLTDADEWTIDITDTGIGIAPTRHSSLFEPFEQADSSIAQTYGGTGLGLALSRRLAERLGGTLILLKSAPGQGTTFRLSLKGPSTSRPIDTAVSASSMPSARPLGGLRILLAEDHADIQRAIRRLLEQAGAWVATVRDGGEAVAKAKADVFDVVLMDLHMPHMDGLQATRALRLQGCPVPILAMTVDPARMHRTEALAAGFDACLVKPFTVDQLIEAIRRPTDDEQ
jgi:signal transduction histidine kinase